MALKTQKRYFNLFRAKIALLLVIAFTASFSWDLLSVPKVYAAIVIAVALIAAMAASYHMDTKKCDQIWFSSRAVAESAKMESWKFMMRVTPYDETISDREAEHLFISRLHEILNSQQSVREELISSMGEQPLIPECMVEIRKSSFGSRRSQYLKGRVKDQKNWYNKKGKWNRDQQRRWYRLGWAAQIVAVIFAITTIAFGALVVNLVGILTTVVAGTSSWTSAKSHRELSQSYGLIAFQLAGFESRTKDVRTEEQFSELVMDVERTISREHTIWIQKRIGLTNAAGSAGR